MKNRKIKLFLLCMLITGSIFILEARSEDSDITYFDDQGRLSFTMRDNPAIHTAYKTIAWTIKRYNLPIMHPDNMTITVQLEDESHLKDDGYVYTTVYVSRDAILEKVKECSLDWFYEIKKIGGTAYLDNIMTVSEDGVLQGTINSDGSYEGEVYDTFEGIAKARAWKNPEDLRQYFGKKIAIPADEHVYEEAPPVIENVQLTCDYNYSDDRLLTGGAGRLTSNEYDVQRAVPVLENVQACGSFSPYAYRLCYRKESGFKTYGVNITVKYTLKWTDSYGNEYIDDVSFSDWYDVVRMYSLYAAETLDVYSLKDWSFENPAIGIHTIENTAFPEVIHSKQAAVMDAPVQENIFYDGGIINGGNIRPAVPDVNLQWLAESAVGDIRTESDCISINGFEILGECGAHRPKSDIMINLTKDLIPIKEKTPNNTFATRSSCRYIKAPVADIRTNPLLSDTEEKNVLVNPLTIHTPVVCNAWINDNRADNQRIFPDETRTSMVLGKTFRVNVCNEGLHIGDKGYGIRDYNKYVLDNEVCFPFDIVRGASSKGVRVSAGTWIRLGKLCENGGFYLPVTVDEGVYTVKFRTSAVNVPLSAPIYPDKNNGRELESYAQEKYNASPNYYYAYDSCEVCVSGQICGFKITGCNDPKWENMSPRGADKLPVDNPALKLGYEFEFEVMTVGNMSGCDMVCIQPHFYHIKEDNTKVRQKTAKEVDLYEIENTNGSDIAVTKLGGLLDINDITCIGETYDGHVKLWHGSFKLPKSTAAVEYGLELEKMINEAIVTKYDDIWENYRIVPLESAKGGFIIINFDIYTKKEDNLYLSYENPINSSRGYCNMWRQEGFDTGRGHKAGDVAAYAGNKTYMEDYIVVGTH